MIKQHANTTKTVLELVLTGVFVRLGRLGCLVPRGDMCFPRRVVSGVLGVLGVFRGLGQDTQDGCHFADGSLSPPKFSASTQTS